MNSLLKSSCQLIATLNLSFRFHQLLSNFLKLEFLHKFFSFSLKRFSICFCILNSNCRFNTRPSLSQLRRSIRLDRASFLRINILLSRPLHTSSHRTERCFILGLLQYIIWGSRNRIFIRSAQIQLVKQILNSIVRIHNFQRRSLNTHRCFISLSKPYSVPSRVSIVSLDLSIRQHFVLVVGRRWHFSAKGKLHFLPNQVWNRIAGSHFEARFGCSF